MALCPSPSNHDYTCAFVCAAAIDTEATDILLQFSLICDINPNSDAGGLAEVASPRIGVVTSDPLDAEAMAR